MSEKISVDEFFSRLDEKFSQLSFGPQFQVEKSAENHFRHFEISFLKNNINFSFCEMTLFSVADFTPQHKEIDILFDVSFPAQFSSFVALNQKENNLQFSLLEEKIAAQQQIIFFVASIKNLLLLVKFE